MDHPIIKSEDIYFDLVISVSVLFTKSLPSLPSYLTLKKQVKILCRCTLFCVRVGRILLCPLIILPTLCNITGYITGNVELFKNVYDKSSFTFSLISLSFPRNCFYWLHDSEFSPFRNGLMNCAFSNEKAIRL